MDVALKIKKALDLINELVPVLLELGKESDWETQLAKWHEVMNAGKDTEE